LLYKSGVEMLDKVSFADKIVFGRLNYSAKIRAFPHARELYNDRARAVVNFCKDGKIKQQGSLRSRTLDLPVIHALKLKGNMFEFHGIIFFG